MESLGASRLRCQRCMALRPILCWWPGRGRAGKPCQGRRQLGVQGACGSEQLFGFFGPACWRSAEMKPWPSVRREACGRDTDP